MQKMTARRRKLWLGKSLCWDAAGGWTWQRAPLQTCPSFAFLPWPPLMAGVCLQGWFAFFFNFCKIYVARIAVCVRNGHLMNNINPFNHTLNG